MHDVSTLDLIRRLRGIVAGLRPSIFTMLGIGPPGIDFLGVTGRSAWAATLSDLHRDVVRHQREGNGDGDQDVTRLAMWIEAELEIEEVRWSTADTILGVALAVFEAPRDEDDDLGDVFGVWALTLEDLLREVHEGSAIFTPQSSHTVAQLRRAIAKWPGADNSLQRRLDQLASVDVTASVVSGDVSLLPAHLRCQLGSLLGTK